MDSLLHDICVINEKDADLGLELNQKKCEVISSNPCLLNHPIFESFTKVAMVESTLLGAPLTGGSAMDKILSDRVDDLQRASNRLMLVSRHDALTLLRFSLSSPKLLYTLRSSPCFDHPALLIYDTKLRECLSMITNICLSDSQWSQASLPVKMGGLGIRQTSQIAPSAFLSSVHATKSLQNSILQNIKTSR